MTVQLSRKIRSQELSAVLRELAHNNRLPVTTIHEDLDKLILDPGADKASVLRLIHELVHMGLLILPVTEKVA